MTISRRTLVGAALLSASHASAAPFPTPGRPIRLVVPFPPGGLTDIIARRIAEGLSEVLEVNVVPDNRPGAGGFPAIASLHGAAPDGHTLYVGFIGSHATNASLYARLPYDPVKDFTPVGLMADTPAILTVYPGLPARSLADLIAYARANPGRLNFASTGSGGPAHIALEVLKSRAGIDIVHVPYRGTAQLTPDLMSGVIHGYFDAFTTAAPRVRAGQVRGLAVLTAERMPQLPEVPTGREAGFDFVFSTWFGLLAYGQVPAEARDRLSTALQTALRRSAFVTWCETQGIRSLPGSPAEFARFLETETERLGAIIRAANIRAD